MDYIKLFELVLGHFVADFALQTEAIALGKGRKTNKIKVVPWPYWLTAHAMIHGAIVYVITQNVFLSVCEVVVHWVVDLMKCEGFTNIHQDQVLHIASKVLYVA